MPQAFVRHEDVRSKLNDTVVNIKNMPFWVCYLSGMNVLAIPLFDPDKAVPKEFWEGFAPAEQKAHDYVNGAKGAFVVNSNSPWIDLSVPEYGYVNLFDYTTPTKLKFVGTSWTSRKPSRSSAYGICRTVVDESFCGQSDQPTSVWHRSRMYSWGDALIGNFPSIIKAREMLETGRNDVVAFDKHFAIAKPQAESPFTTIFYNNVKVAILGKKLRVLPLWRKPWFEKILSRHTLLLR